MCQARAALTSDFWSGNAGAPSSSSTARPRVARDRERVFFGRRLPVKENGNVEQRTLRLLFPIVHLPKNGGMLTEEQFRALREQGYA